MSGTSQSLALSYEKLRLSPSINSINSAHSSGAGSSGGEATGLMVEHEDIILLTNDVKNFREILAKLRRFFTDYQAQSIEGKETVKVQVHERLGEVLRVLRIILEKYPPIQSTQLLMAAGKLIQQVKACNYDDETADTGQFFEAVDHLAYTFSSRVSEYLMGDVEANGKNKSRASYDNLVDDIDETESLTPSECDERFYRLPEGIEVALHRAKAWSKYAKDVISFIEKRTHSDAEHARNLIKLAQSAKPVIKEEGFLPFQSIYSSAIDQDTENCNNILANCSLVLGHKFIEPLVARRNEHEKTRKQIKQEWQRELKRTHEALNNMRKAQALYYQRQQEYERTKVSLRIAEAGNEGLTDQNKIERKRKLGDEAHVRAQEAEVNYRNAVTETNERIRCREELKRILLTRIRELMYQCDQTLKAVTVGFFQSQHTVTAPLPVQYQTLCESARLYEPGCQYLEFVKRIKQIPVNDCKIVYHKFVPYDGKEKNNVKRGRSADFPASESESGESGEDGHTSPRASSITVSSGEEIELDVDSCRESGYGAVMRNSLSKASQSHHFRRLKTPSRCRECDAYVCFQGLECTQCGLTCHRKCLTELNIACGNKRVQKKMTTFGIDLKSHCDEVPYIVVKCIAELDKRGITTKGIYRVSGVKSRVEKLCQTFEIGADLVDISDVPPNIIANVLKLYLRQLPEPLMTFKSYPDFIRIAKQYPSSALADDMDTETESNMICQLRDAANRLPPVHFNTLSYLCHHLKRVADQHEINNMPSSNLGIVFGPTLLRTSEGTASLSSLVDTVHQTRVVQLLITFADQVFGSPPRLPVTSRDASLDDSESQELAYECIEEDVEAEEPTVTVIKEKRDTKTSSYENISEKIIQQSKVTDINEIPAEKFTNYNNNNDDPSSLYPASSVVKLSGQQVITSTFNPSKSMSDCSSKSFSRPSLNELRRQFFTSSSPPPQLRSLPVTTSSSSGISSTSLLSLPHQTSLANSKHCNPLQTKIKTASIVSSTNASLSSIPKTLSLSSSSASINRTQNKDKDNAGFEC